MEVSTITTTETNNDPRYVYFSSGNSFCEGNIVLSGSSFRKRPYCWAVPFDSFFNVSGSEDNVEAGSVLFFFSNSN